MKAALYNRVFEQEDIPTLQELIQLLEELEIGISIYKDFYERLESFIKFTNTPHLFTGRHDLNSDVDYLISLGGDGTMLDAVCFIGSSGIPAIGINLGRLGFLADVREDEIKMALIALSKGAYTIDKRTLLHLDSNNQLFGNYPFALNEFTIHRKDTSQMIKIHAYLNGEFLNTYWADGLIISTPTGSTGYSLSCGGPVVFPQASNFVITPVAPHNLNIRSIIVPDDNVISFEVEGRTDYFLCTLDSRSESITKDIQLAVRRENFDFKLIRLNEQHFLNTIRQKLYWGIDSRN